MLPIKKIVLHVLAILGLILCLNFSIFFGLQVNTLLGNVSLLITFLLVLMYIGYNIKSLMKK